jgi:2-C-methyl-D-erythritol 4-phosphate cytidylyltransferase/2-C-methyl-D-erythritol 2,4-cyclodiphosphate synthase
LGDIGTFFPDTDPSYKNADSKLLLTHCVNLIRSIGFDIVHADLTIIAQTPRLEAYKGEMKKVLATLLGIAPNRLNIKATTAEKLGFIGRKEGVCVMSTATLTYFDWRKL